MTSYMQFKKIYVSQGRAGQRSAPARSQSGEVFRKAVLLWCFFLLSSSLGTLKSNHIKLFWIMCIVNINIVGLLDLTIGYQRMTPRPARTYYRELFLRLLWSPGDRYTVD